jgi:hypothetical protein
MTWPRSALYRWLDRNPDGVMHAVLWGPFFVLVLILLVYLNVLVNLYGSEWERQSLPGAVICAPNRLIELPLPETARAWWQHQAALPWSANKDEKPDWTWVVLLVVVNVLAAVLAGWLAWVPILRWSLAAVAGYARELQREFRELYEPFRGRTG